MGEATGDAGAVETVFDMAVKLLQEREGDEGVPDTETWATGSEIAHRTGIDKQLVLDALRSMSQERLYIRGAEGSDDIEVLGVAH